jgi:hypothetical protein
LFFPTLHPYATPDPKFFPIEKVQKAGHLIRFLISFITTLVDVKATQNQSTTRRPRALRPAPRLTFF